MSTDVSEGQVKLWNNKREREECDNKADLFALIKTVDRLEKAYVRDAISAEEYEATCFNFIAKFKTLTTTIGYSHEAVEDFIVEYNIDSPAAVNRLLVSGVPATVQHGTPSRPEAGESHQPRNSAVAVAETVQHFITTMDSLNLKMVATDQIYPLLNDLMQSLNKLSDLPPEFEGKVKVKEWMSRLDKMRASDELSEEQVRQLLFDLESSYNAVLNILRGEDT
mmetsp:Transcript_37832/g.45608  ORF Transcript_37832/g.45608 Transcript_37832/m.45608 type:complete len:223 (-) Transcript_37832:606-1274(-)|eukprot:CAMPEP_0197847690 /NCGR_PEP_ID=MMETSP1438-20131217/6801_1 /TAXON_ID=1461541 /ORGANISM="Pterosperma sp., Strain CCMP1384" /LENGTH=222 /DNA_ID=CAMNT_0043459683 /DNA_START=425 /DNA_END=1093 /DNA_ORIENTATION=+